jgi:hypothetical protein
MAEANPKRREPPADEQFTRYSATGHPSIEQLMAEQGTGPGADVSVLHGDFWPEEATQTHYGPPLAQYSGSAPPQAVRSCQSAGMLGPGARPAVH